MKYVYRATLSNSPSLTYIAYYTVEERRVRMNGIARTRKNEDAPPRARWSAWHPSDPTVTGRGRTRDAAIDDFLSQIGEG